jgi:serine/threonine protein kinase
VPSDAKSVIAGRYELLERRQARAGGARGVVHRARDLRLLRIVAIRVVPINDGADLRGLIKGLHLMAAATGHPHVVGLYDALLPEPESLPSPAFVVMEFVDGPSLAHERNALVDPVSARRLGLELRSALTHLHSLGIGHGDVRPSSVLIDPDGRAKLTLSGRIGVDPADDLAALGLMLRALGAEGPADDQGRTALRAMPGGSKADRDAPVATTAAVPVATAQAS